MNQLQNLLHDALISTNHVDRCALINFENGEITAASVGFYLNEEDVEALIDAFDNISVTRERGLFFQDCLYTAFRADNEAIYAKDGNKGVIMIKTKMHILMGTFKENMYPSVCVEALDNLASYFKAKDK